MDYQDGPTGSYFYNYTEPVYNQYQEPTYSTNDDFQDGPTGCSYDFNEFKSKSIDELTPEEILHYTDSKFWNINGFNIYDLRLYTQIGMIRLKGDNKTSAYVICKTNRDGVFEFDNLKLLRYPLKIYLDLYNK